MDHNRTEIAIRIEGAVCEHDLDALGRALAELAVIPFRERCCWEPLSILEGIRFPMFPRMQHALVAHWFVTTPAWLPEISPPVLLLMVVPIMPLELKWLVKFGPEAMYLELEHRGVSIYDPLRTDTLEVA